VSLLWEKILSRVEIEGAGERREILTSFQKRRERTISLQSSVRVRS